MGWFISPVYFTLYCLRILILKLLITNLWACCIHSKLSVLKNYVLITQSLEFQHWEMLAIHITRLMQVNHIHKDFMEYGYTHTNMYAHIYKQTYVCIHSSHTCTVCLSIHFFLVLESHNKSLKCK